MNCVNNDQKEMTVAEFMKDRESNSVTGKNLSEDYKAVWESVIGKNLVVPVFVHAFGEFTVAVLTAHPTGGVVMRTTSTCLFKWNPEIESKSDAASRFTANCAEYKAKFF